MFVKISGYFKAKRKIAFKLVSELKVTIGREIVREKLNFSKLKEFHFESQIDLIMMT